MNSYELQAAYGGEQPTPMVELAKRRIQALLHDYFNSVPQPVLEVVQNPQVTGGEHAA